MTALRRLVCWLRGHSWLCSGRTWPNGRESVGYKCLRCERWRTVEDRDAL